MLKKFLSIVCLFSIHLNAINWLNPDVEDFEYLQEKLKNSEFPYIDYLVWHRKGLPPWYNRANALKNFTFVENGKFDKDVTIIPFGDNPDKVAVCCYLSFNWDRIRSDKDVHCFIKSRIENLKKHSFKGDFVYQIGGYPNVSEGDLQFYDVPYAFKLAMIRRMQRLGYKKILWMDGMIEVLKPLGPVWRSLDRHPIFAKYSIWPFQEYCPAHIRKATHLSDQEWRRMKHFSTMVLGLNFQDPSTQIVLDQMYELAIQKTAFFSYFPEQIPLSIILQKNNIKVNGGLFDRHFVRH